MPSDLSQTEPVGEHWFLWQWSWRISLISAMALGKVMHAKGYYCQFIHKMYSIILTSDFIDIVNIAGALTCVSMPVTNLQIPVTIHQYYTVLYSSWQIFKFVNTFIPGLRKILADKRYLEQSCDIWRHVKPSRTCDASIYPVHTDLSFNIKRAHDGWLIQRIVTVMNCMLQEDTKLYENTLWLKKRTPVIFSNNFNKYWSISTILVHSVTADATSVCATPL